MAKVELKQPIIEEIKSYSDQAKAAVLVDYRGLTVEQDTKLRKELRDEGIVYKVYKNTMLTRAFEGTDFEQLSKDLEGPTAVAFSQDDETAPARILSKYVKEIESLEFKSAVVGGTYYDVDGIQVLAKIPSRDELISKLLGSLQSPITNFARVLNQIAEAAPAEDAPAEEAPVEAEAEAPAEEAAAEAPAEEAAAEAPAEDAAEEKTEE